jgi:large subunit ribosomal protein L30
MAATKHFEVKLVRSGAGRTDRQRRTLAGLGLKRMNQVVFLGDSEAIRGMLYKVVHLVSVTPRTGEKPPSAREKAAVRAANIKASK